MKLMLQSGVILEPASDDVAQQYLKYGAVELIEKADKKEAPIPTKKTTAKKAAE